MTMRPLRWEEAGRRAARRATAIALALVAALSPLTAAAQGGVATGGVAAVEPDSSSQRDAILLNFEGADIREVIYTFAAALNLNYWLDPRVQGQVTARSFGPIYVDDLYPVFLQILRSNGYAAVREGDLYMIVPAEDGKTRAKLRMRDTTQDFVIELVKVEHVSAERIVELLNPFVSQGGDVSAYSRNNLLIIADIAANAKRMRELVQTFDNDTFDDMQGKVYRVKHAAVEEIAEEMLTILESYQVVDSGARMQLIPLVRLNSLAVVAFDPAIFANVEYWLDVLDVPGEGGSERRVYVYRVENSRALELSEVLNEVYAGLAEDSGDDGRGRSGALAERGLGLGGGLDQQRRRGRQQQAQTQEPQSGLVLPGSPAGGEGLAGTLFEQEVRIVADELTNSLVILATPRDYGMIRSVLNELDIVPRQVLVEMLIAEITLTDDVDLGVTHRLGSGVQNPDSNAGGGGGGPDPTPQDMLRMLPGVGGLLVGNPAAAGATRVDGSVGGTGLDMMFTNVAGDYQLTITALAQETELKILSRPHIMTADNQEARILVGQEIPIVTSQGAASQQIAGTSNVLQQVQYRDTGVVVQVTPQVNSEGLINMTVSQEVSEVAEGAQVQGISSPSFTTREAETTVVVQSGETIIIGGIIQETKTESRSGVPYLMDIPVLGQLFRSTGDNKRRTELIILITPYVVRSRDEADTVTSQFRDRVDALLRELNIEDESAQGDSHTVILQKPGA